MTRPTSGFWRAGGGSWTQGFELLPFYQHQITFPHWRSRFFFIFFIFLLLWLQRSSSPYPTVMCVKCCPLQRRQVLRCNQLAALVLENLIFFFYFQCVCDFNSQFFSGDLLCLNAFSYGYKNCFICCIGLKDIFCRYIFLKCRSLLHCCFSVPLSSKISHLFKGPVCKN